MRCVRRVLSIGLIGLTALSAPASAEGGAQPFAGATVASVDWRKGQGRMSLGHRAQSKPAPEVEIATQRTSAARQCRRWRALASQLGETYAGHRLRSTVLERLCTQDDETADAPWGWPWSDMETGATLPPTAHRSFGVWDIRCDATGARKRCALIHRSPVPPDGTLDPGDPEIVVHFVIDMVAGRETVLWRMFVPASRTQADFTAAVTPAALPSATPAARGQGEVRYRLGGSDQVERFPACTSAGCFMEAHVARSGAVVSRLWDGRPMEITVARPSGDPLTLRLPARGFRAAFSELVRLRRDEMRGSARR
jgi:invasion protein IalB